MWALSVCVCVRRTFGAACHVMRLLCGGLRLDQLVRLPRLLHQVPELEASVQALQHVGLSRRMHSLHYCHVPHGLEDRSCHLHHYRLTLLRHCEEQA